MQHGTNKLPVVIWSFGRNQLIFRRNGRFGLQQFLQLAFWIINSRNFCQRTKVIRKFAQNKFARGVKSAVQKNRAEQCFKRIGQSGSALASSAGFFAVAQYQMRAKFE